MKTNILKTVFLTTICIVAFSFPSCNTENPVSNFAGNSSNYPNSQDLSELKNIIDQIPITDVTSDEKLTLIFMREEEKLARDVYQVLYNTWGQMTFNNISFSEQTHTTSIKYLIEKYGLNDPVISDENGAFTNIDLQNLYAKLINDGKVSLINALKVGAEIEEIDIIDLDNAIIQTNNEDIKIVYQNLRSGSTNHLRSFVKVLSQNGISYKPEYLSDTEYNSIVN